MFSHILVPLDGSAPAEEALPVAARIVRASRGSIHLLTVVKSPIDYGEEYDWDALLSEQEIETGTTVATDYLRTVLALPVLDRIQVTTEIAPGLSAQYILAAAKSGEFDLTVLCSYRRMGFTRWVLGSVTHTLVHESTIPTLVLHENESAALLAHPDAARPLRALVPLDGSPLAEAALEPAAHLVASLAARGELHLTHVVKPLQNPAEEASRARASTYLTQVTERWQAMAMKLGISISWSVALETDVASALLSQAEPGEQGQRTAGSRGYDLIAISTHGRHGLERWVMGSVSDRLLNTTKLPILIVRHREKDEE